MTARQTFAAHTFANEAEISFDRAAYSRLKHGDDAAAASLGAELAEVFIKQIAEPALRAHGNDATFPGFATCSAVEAAPTAALRLAQHMSYGVNRWLAVNHPEAPAVMEISLRREYRVGRAFVGDYGAMNDADRAQRLADASLYLDVPLLGERILVVVDDCRVTGRTEGEVHNFLTGAPHYQPAERLRYMYYANCSVPPEDPRLESRLNEAAYEIEMENKGKDDSKDPGLQLISSIILRRDWVPNQRAIKRICRARPEELRNLVRAAAAKDIKRLATLVLNSALALEFWRTPDYSTGLDTLRELEAELKA